MLFRPVIYAHIAPDGRLLEARTDPPVSQVTMGGEVHKYVPKASWMMSDNPEFTFPEEDRPVVVKILTSASGAKVHGMMRYRALPYFMKSQAIWGLWGWKYLED